MNITIANAGSVSLCHKACGFVLVSLKNSLSAPIVDTSGMFLLDMSLVLSRYLEASCCSAWLLQDCFFRSPSGRAMCSGLHNQAIRRVGAP